MSEFDSRLLRYTDCFGQKLPATGQYRFQLGIKPSMRLADVGGDHGHSVEVQDGEGTHEAVQRHVPVDWKNGTFEPQVAVGKASAGDVLTWSGAGPDTPPFEVEMTGPGGNSGSGSMSNGALVTHAFLVPGTYTWHIGDQKEPAGRIRVDQVIAHNKDEFDAWVKSVSQGPMVRIVSGRPDHGDLQIPVGGTICWTVETSSNVFIVVEPEHSAA
jgi:hypothetical protein